MQPDSLYNCGMKPLMYSENLARTKNIGWVRHGNDIKYYRNKRQVRKKKQSRSIISVNMFHNYLIKNISETDAIKSIFTCIDVACFRYYVGKAERNYYSLTWTVQFNSNRDTCYFAHCYPYTYSDLQVILYNVY